jgi:hypothetical protein
MIARRIALVLLLATPLAGCAQKLGCTSTATIVIEGLSRNPPEARAILIDSSLNPEINETRGKGFLWDTKQHVVINSSVPMKLVRAVPDGPNSEKVATTHTATIEVSGFPDPLGDILILIDPSLNAEVNEVGDAWKLWPWRTTMDLNQRVVIRSSVPLRLIPADRQELDELDGKWYPSLHTKRRLWRSYSEFRSG